MEVDESLVPVLARCGQTHFAIQGRDRPGPTPWSVPFKAVNLPVLRATSDNTLPSAFHEGYSYRVGRTYVIRTGKVVDDTDQPSLLMEGNNLASPFLAEPIDLDALLWRRSAIESVAVEDSDVHTKKNVADRALQWGAQGRARTPDRQRKTAIVNIA